jgi:Glycine/sarcosine/betaine reductase selenoprotein B (GRDB)
MQILDNREQWLDSFRTGWLAHYQQTGQLDWKLYNRPKNSTAVAGPGVDLRERRLILISSAGGYLRDRQTPFDAPNPLGDYTVRLFSSATPFSALAYAHEHYDHAAVDADPQVLVPLGHLADLVVEGVIGELAPTVISFSGYQPYVTRVLDETIPLIVQAAQADRADAALLVPA